MKGTYYFSLLSSLEQNQFRYNLENNIINITLVEYLNCEFYDFNEFIGFSFNWCESREGISYWVEISNRKVNAGLIIKKYIKKVELC
jgi:hypothetical protein